MEAKHLGVTETRLIIDDSQSSEGNCIPELTNIEREQEVECKDTSLTFRRRLKRIIWDTLDYTLEERKFVSKIDFFIL